MQKRRHFSFYRACTQAWLDGLSPKENRDIPPLDYGLVYQLKQAHPDLLISINGGIETLQDCASQQNRRGDAGTRLIANPYLLASVDAQLFGDADIAPSREEVEGLIPYAEKLVANGTPLHALTRHVAGLFQGLPGGRYGGGI